MSRIVARKRNIGKNAHHAGKISLPIYTTGIPLLPLLGSVLGSGEQRE